MRKRVISHFTNTNKNGSTFDFRNQTDKVRTYLVNLNSGNGSLSKKETNDGLKRYWNEGSKGVEVQVFKNGVLQETISGGTGNPYKHIEDRYIVRWGARKCGRYWYGAVKWCNDVPIYGFRGTNVRITRSGGNNSKSFITQLKPNELLQVKFVGNANIVNTGFDGNVSVSELPLEQPGHKNYIWMPNQYKPTEESN